jgi:RecA-family ATPase
LLPEGVALLAGRPKKGKSLLALNIAVAKATGGKALGRYDVEPGDVAYLALEDGKRRVKTRIENLMPPGQPWPDRLSLTYAAPRIVVDASGKASVDEGLLQALTGWIKEASNPSLTIVDILARVKPSQRTKGRGDIYQEDYELISAFVELAQKHGITILLVTHTSKRRSEDIFDDIMGTTGVSGGSSTNLVLQRLNDGSSLDGILHVTGKDAEDQSIGLSFDHGTWHAKGDAEAYQQSQERLELFEVLYTASGKGLTPKDLTEALDKKGGTVRKMLHTLREQGLVRGDEQGRYFLSDKGAAVIKAHNTL